MRITVYFKRLNSLRLSLLAYSECAADGELEGGMFLKEGGGRPVGSDGIQKRCVVGEVRAVGDDRRLEVGANQQRVVGPIDPERRVDHGEQHLHFEAGRHAGGLRSGRDHGALRKTGLWKLAVQVGDALWI